VWAAAQVERNRFGPGEEELSAEDFEDMGLTFADLERGGEDRPVTLDNRGDPSPPPRPLPSSPSRSERVPVTRGLSPHTADAVREGG
jgi:hypothetical protein